MVHEAPFLRSASCRSSVLPPGPDSANTDHPAPRGLASPPSAPRPRGHCPPERTWGARKLVQASALPQPPPRLPLHCWDDFCLWNTSVFHLLTFSRWQEADNCVLFVDFFFFFLEKGTQSALQGKFDILVKSEKVVSSENDSLLTVLRTRVFWKFSTVM